jgi:Poly-gamma-glutamate hydrolase
MATYNASVKKALTASQQDLIDHKEHCSADPVKLATVGRERGHQVRIKRNDSDYGLYTVSQVRQESPDNIVRMGSTGRERLGTSDEFVGSLDSQVPHPTFDDLDAETNNEFVERLEDNGTHTGLVVIAPHGGHIEPHTDQQAERVASRLAAKAVSLWRCKGFKGEGLLLAGTSPRPTFTRQVFLSSARSSLGASPMPSPSMASTTPKSPSTSSSAALRPTP